MLSVGTNGVHLLLHFIHPTTFMCLCHSLESSWNLGRDRHGNRLLGPDKMETKQVLPLPLPHHEHQPWRHLRKRWEDKAEKP